MYVDLCKSYQFYLHILYSRHISSNLFLFYWWVPKFQEQITTRNIESSKKHHLTFKPNIISNPPQPVQSNRPTGGKPVETGDCVLGARIPHTQPIIHASSMVPKDSRWILIDQHLWWAFREFVTTNCRVVAAGVRDTPCIVMRIHLEWL